jgi:hypothetical protein
MEMHGETVKRGIRIQEKRSEKANGQGEPRTHKEPILKVNHP